jgi:hypothetical protein
VEDTKVLARELRLAGFVDEARPPHPKALFAGVDRCEGAVKRGDADVTFLLHCSGP